MGLLRSSVAGKEPFKVGLIQVMTILLIHVNTCVGEHLLTTGHGHQIHSSSRNYLRRWNFQKLEKIQFL